MSNQLMVITPEMVTQARKSGRNLVYVPLLYVPVVAMDDEPLHTDEHPRCSDPSCPCQETKRAAQGVA